MKSWKVEITHLEAQVDWLQERLTLCERKLELPELPFEEFLRNRILSKSRNKKEGRDE